MLLLLAFACTGDDVPGLDFEMEPRDLGAREATGSGYDFDTPQLAFFAAQHAVPDLGWEDPPPTRLILYIWENVLLGANVSDAGTCPYTLADGSATTWKSDCRSLDGYNWTGDVTRDDFELDGIRWRTADFDVEVIADVEDPAFDRIALKGSFIFAAGDDAPLTTHVDANYVIEADGYWERGFKDEVEPAWQRMAVSGTWETLTITGGQRYLLDSAIDLGDYGGFTAMSEGLDQLGCVGEPEGRVELTGAQDALLEFEGEARCDNCAALYIDGEASPMSCNPNWY